MRSLRHASPRPLSTSIARLTSRALLSAALALAAGSIAPAANVVWEPDGVLGAPTGGTGAWDTTNAFWDDAGSLRAWLNANVDTAIFGLNGVTANPPYTVTLGTAITAGGLTFNASNYTVTGNTLTLAGTPVITVTNAGTVAQVNSILAGSAGFTTAGAGQLFLGGANTFTGVMTIGSGSYVGVNNALALGSNASGNYTNVLSGGTLNIGGFQINNNPAPATPGEEIRIAGTGVGGIGALINTVSGGINSLGKVVLTADATISAGNGSAYSYNAAGAVVNGVGARLDIRLSAAPTAGQKHLDLAGFTLTKIGGDRLALVNADVSAGNIVVNEGALGIEGGTLLTGAADGSGGATRA
jgi:fibronectin-binding autotransporter adhesin